MIYHFCARSEWEAAVPAGRYVADSLTAQGFIHCSPRDHLHAGPAGVTPARPE